MVTSYTYSVFALIPYELTSPASFARWRLMSRRTRKGMRIRVTNLMELQGSMEFLLELFPAHRGWSRHHHHHLDRMFRVQG